jgi:hypothetical protein
MLGGEDHARHAGGGQRLDNRVGIEPRGVENVRVFVAEPPFAVGKSVDGEMKEGSGFKPVPGQLPGGRHRPERLWFRGCEG